MLYRSLTFSWMLFSLVPAVSFAQNSPQPSVPAPPEIEQALRARVTELFRLFVERDFRSACALVAEDARDYYLATPKGKVTFESFKITGVRFLNGDFTKASVDLECTQKVQAGERAGTVESVSIATLWK